MTKQAENDTLKKQSETLEHKLKALTKENENAKADITSMQATIADLKEQVRKKLFYKNHRQYDESTKHIKTLVTNQRSRYALIECIFLTEKYYNRVFHNLFFSLRLIHV